MDFNHSQNLPNLGWWLQVDARNPICIYFFGPFTSQEEAERSKDGFFTDLRQEGAYIIYSEIKFCQPRQLTIYEDELNIRDLETSSTHFFLNLVQHQGIPGARKQYSRTFNSSR